MAALQEKLDEMARIKAELQRMEDDDSVTEETDGDLRDTLVQRWKKLDEECKPIVARMQEIQSITRAASASPANLEGGSDDGVRRFAPPEIVTRTQRDPYEDLDAIRSKIVTRADLRARALDAIELEARRSNLPHDFAEQATLVAQDNPGVARHILLTGSPEYQEAFRAYLENPEENISRAALSLTNANGGYLLPFVLDPTIVLTNTGSANPWRRISTIKQTTSNTWNGVTSAGVNAAWLTEGSTVTDGSPTVGNIQITPQKAAAWVFGSYEVLEDTDFGQQLPRLLADAKDRLEEAAFATGAGSGGVPQGVLTGATTVVTTATTLTVAVGDVYATQQALPPRFRNAPGAGWVSNVALINKFRQLDTAGGASFWTNLGKGAPETLLGAPIYESTTMASALTSGNLLAVFGDFGQYYIVDRVGVSLIYEPLVKGSGSNLPSGQAGWFLFWRTGAQVAVPNAFRVMKGA